MAILWMDGFDHYTTGSGARAELISAGYTVISTAQSVVDATSQTFLGTGKSLNLANNNRGIGYATTGSPSSIGAATHIQPTNVADTDDVVIFSFLDASNFPQVTVSIEGATGRLTVRRGNVGGTLLATSTNSLFTDNVFTHVEAFVTIDNTAGAVEIRVNGNSTPVINISSVDTQDRPTSEIAVVLLNCVSLGGSVSAFRFDNFYVWDTTGAVNNTFLGERRVETVVPDADTATEDWTPLTGVDSFAMVDEIGPDDDTSYLSSNTTANRTVLDTANLVDTTGTTLAVAAFARTRKTDASAATYALGIRSSTSETQSANIAPSTSYEYNGFVIAQQNPNGPVNWTPTTAQAAQLAIEDTT